jgi:hypothetical protein
MEKVINLVRKYKSIIPETQKMHTILYPTNQGLLKKTAADTKLFKSEVLSLFFVNNPFTLLLTMFKKDLVFCL